MGSFLDILVHCKLNFLYETFFCRFERCKVVISFNNSGSSSLSSPINANFRSNHVNGYMYYFHSLIHLSLLLFFVVFFHNIGCGYMNIVKVVANIVG